MSQPLKSPERKEGKKKSNHHHNRDHFFDISFSENEMQKLLSDLNLDSNLSICHNISNMNVSVSELAIKCLLPTC